MNKRDNYRILIPVLAVLILLAIGISVYFVLHDDDAPKSTSVTDVTDTDKSGADTRDSSSFDAIITGIDLDSLSITLTRLGENQFEEYFYNGATQILTKYDRQVTATLLKPGDFVSIEFGDNNLLTKVSALKDIDVYEKILSPVIEADPMRITIADEVYRYDDNLLILNDGYFVGLDTLVSTDILTAYSRDGFVYLLKVFSGHGYLSLSHATGFLGGTISITHEGDFEITTDFVRTLPEGEYNVRVSNGEDSGSETVLISRDKTSILDLSAFLPDGSEFGVITLSLTPEDSFVYIDGVMKDTSAPISVAYGEHRIDVIADGYTSYEGPLTISKPSSTLNISLPVAPAGDSITGIDDSGYASDENPDGPDSSPVSGSDSTLHNQTASPGIQTVTEDPDIPDSTSDMTGDSYVAPDGEDPDEGADSGNLDEDSTTDYSGEGNTGNVSSGSDDLQMIIYCTDGSAVYINDVYKGTIADGRLSFKKPDGTVSVRIVKEGYVTKYYTVSVEDDGENAEYRFPAMVPAG